MFKIFKKIFIITFIISLSYTNFCFAYKGDYKEGEIITYSQGGSTPWAGKVIRESTGTTVKEMGCSYLSAYYMLIATKVWAFPQKNPWDLISLCKDKSYYAADSPGLCYFGYQDIAKITNNRIKLVSAEDSAASGASVGSDSLHKRIQELMLKKGYFCIMCVVGGPTQGHYIYIDDPTDKNWVIGDSGFFGSKINDAYSSGVTCAKLRVYKLLDDKGKQIKWSKDYSMYGNKGEGDSNPSPSPATDTPSTEGAPNTIEEGSNDPIIDKEENLYGMPEKSKLMNSRVIITEISDKDLINAEQFYSAEIIKEMKAYEKESKQNSLIKSIVTFIGLLIIVYSVLFLLAYLFDMIYIGKYFSLFALITLGHSYPAILKSKTEHAYGKNFMSLRSAIIRASILIIVGALLISGVIFVIIFDVVEFVGSKIS